MLVTVCCERNSVSSDSRRVWKQRLCPADFMAAAEGVGRTLCSPRITDGYVPLGNRKRGFSNENDSASWSRSQRIFKYLTYSRPDLLELHKIDSRTRQLLEYPENDIMKRSRLRFENPLFWLPSGTYPSVILECHASVRFPGHSYM